MSVATLKADYQDTSPIRRVHFVTPDPNSSDTNPSLVVDHYRYIDGLGETRASIEHVDTQANSTQWLLSGVHGR